MILVAHTPPPRFCYIFFNLSIRYPTIHLFQCFIPSSFYNSFIRAPDVCVASVHLALQYRVCGIVRGPCIYARTQTHSHARVRVGSVCLATQYVCVQAVFLLAEHWYALLTYQERKKQTFNLPALALHVDAPVISYSKLCVCVRFLLHWGNQMFPQGQ